jgi:RNA-directed DNA polymerase
LKDAIREKTRRTSGESLPSIIAEVNRTLRGWFVYFQHAPQRVFPPLDMWIRQRLRAILKKRNKRRGCAKGWDFRQWPNAFFADIGLFSLVTAHNLACQSLTR